MWWLRSLLASCSRDRIWVAQPSQSSDNGTITGNHERLAWLPRPGIRFHARSRRVFCLRKTS